MSLNPTQIGLFIDTWRARPDATPTQILDALSAASADGKVGPHLAPTEGPSLADQVAAAGVQPGTYLPAAGDTCHRCRHPEYRHLQTTSNGTPLDPPWTCLDCPNEDEACREIDPAERTMSVVTADGTAMAEATLCGTHFTDETLRRHAEGVAAGADDAPPTPVWHDTTGNPSVECVECGAPEPAPAPAPEWAAGDWADHVSGRLDPREVAEVGPGWLRLRIGSLVTEPVPAANYRRLPPRTHSGDRS